MRRTMWWVTSSVSLLGCSKSADTGEHDSAIVCEEAPGTVCRLAGTGAPGAIEGEEVATKSPLYAPMDVASGPLPGGFMVADWNNHKIRWVDEGRMTTVIGTAFLGDGDPDFQERIPPGVDGTQVALNHPTSVEWNPATERWLMPSWHNHRIREYDAETGLSLVVAADTDITDGNGANSGFAGDGGPASAALMSYPSSIAVDHATGDFWFIDQRNNRLRWVSADFSLIETVSGGADAGLAGDGGPVEDARFFFWIPEELQPEPSGAVEFDGERRRLYIADTSNHRIRVVDLETSTINTLAGWPEQTLPDGACDPNALCFPRDVELHEDWLYVADTDNHVVRRLSLVDGSTEVIAGQFQAGPTQENRPAIETGLSTPHGIDITPDGHLLIADTYNHQILKVFAP